MKLWSWIAYWAAGWHINLVQYQKDIYSILLQMHKALPSIHVANRTYVDDFLEESVMRRVEALCRSLRPLQNTPINPKLLAVADEVASCQLEHLNENLKAMEFVIQSPFEAMVTISGSARVETWIFPLLYLLLKRYLEIVNIAKSVVLDPSEFDSHVDSLTSVFKVFDERMNNLEAKFRQLHKDVDAQFHSFSYGMFYAAYKGNELDIWLNTLLTQTHGYIDQKDTSVTGKQIPNTSILSKPIGEVLKLDDFNLLPSSASLPEHVAHPIEGEWFGWFSWGMHQHVNPHQCVIYPIVDNKLAGKGVAYFGSIDFIGTISLDPNSDKTRVKFAFIPTESQKCEKLVCEGVYDPVRDIITGVLVQEGMDGELMLLVSDEQLITLTATSEPGTEVSKISKDEQKEADEGEETDITDGSEKSRESKPPEPSAEKWTIINNKGTTVVKTTTDGIQNGHTRLPTPNSPVSSNVNGENANSDTPSQTSIDVKEPSGGIETVEEPPNVGSMNSDNPKSPTFYETGNMEQKKAEEMKDTEAPVVNGQNEEDFSPEKSGEKPISEELAVDESTSDDKGFSLPTEGAQNGDTQSPTNGTSANSDIDAENTSAVAPTGISSEVNGGPEGQPSLSVKTAKEPLCEDASKLAIDSSTALNAGDETQAAQPESTEKAEGESESSDDESEGEEDEPDGRFYLTRTPPHLFRFRTLLDGPGPIPCWSAWPLWRKRWAFATEAVRYETHLPMWSKKATSKAFAIVKGENANSDPPPQTSIDVKEPSCGTGTVEGPPNAGLTNSDNPKSPITQTPPHLFRFRTLLDEPGPAPLWRKRWLFAMEAVRYETRLRMWLKKAAAEAIAKRLRMRPKKAVVEAIAERRRWIYHSIRYDLSDPSITPYWWCFDSFTDEEWEVSEAMIMTVEPRIARIWEETAHFMARRETYIVGRQYCDLCTNNIAFCRYQCIMCIKDDFMYFCQNCFDKPEGVLRDAFQKYTHLPSHSLLRSRKRVHTYEVNSLIPAARLTSEQCKTRFRELEKTKNSEKIGAMQNVMEGRRLRKAVPEKLPEDVTSQEPPTCSCCDRKVALPCLVCFECPSLIYICMSCDRKNAHIKQDAHSVLEHRLLLIHDSVEVKSSEAVNVERQLDDINKSILNQHDDINMIIALEGKVQHQFQELKDVVMNMAKTMGMKWDENAANSAEVTMPRTGPDAIGPQVGGPAVPGADLHEEEGNADTLQVKSTIGYGGPSLTTNENGGEKSEFGGDTVQLSLHDRLKALEESVGNINQKLSSIAQDNVLGNKLDALEAKMDRQFGAVLALMQNFIVGQEPANETSNGSVI